MKRAIAEGLARTASVVLSWPASRRHPGQIVDQSQLDPSDKLESSRVQNPQFFVFNENRELLDQPRTIICTGMGRSGTTAVMSLIEFLGVWVGAKDDSPNRENKELRKAIAAGPEAAEALIAKYNKRLPIWGFKAPSLRRGLADTLRMFRNPMIVVPHRDPVGKLGRQMVAEQKEVTLHDIHRLIISHRRLIEELKQVEAPQLHMSFPLVVGSPRDALQAISNFVGLPIRKGDLEAHMNRFRHQYLAAIPQGAP